jgi:hypothetical protein
LSQRIRKAFGKSKIDEDVIYESPGLDGGNQSLNISGYVAYEDPTYNAGNQSTNISDSVSYE